MTTIKDISQQYTAVRLASIGTAVPSYIIEQKEVLSLLAGRYGNIMSRRMADVMEKVFTHTSIRQRHFAIESPDALFGEDPDSKMERFRAQAVALASRAAHEALARSGLTKNDVGALVVNTCTGYLCPGISTYLIEDMDLRRDITAYDLVGAGCGGAAPNLSLGRALLPGMDDKVVLSVAVEICSATFQMGDDISLIVSNALFGDGAAAAVLWKRPRGLRLEGSLSHYLPEYRDDIRFVYKNGQLHNQLTTRLPGLAGKAVRELVESLLSQHDLVPGDVRHWALHSGGANVIDAVKAELGLSEEQLAATRGVLSEYGNMSSPTSLFALQRLMDTGMAPGDRCILAAFGAGFSAHAILFSVH